MLKLLFSPLYVLMHINAPFVNVDMMRGSASRKPVSWMALGLRIHELPRVQLADACCHSNKCRVVTREIYCGSVVLFYTHKPVIHQRMWRDHETHRDSWFAMKHFAQLWCEWMGSRRLIFIVIFLSRRVLNLLLPRRPPRCSSWLEASRKNRNRHTVKQELTVKMKGGIQWVGDTCSLSTA